jgi:hypothetical protein
MPRTIQLERPPAGFAATAMLPGEEGLIEIFGFHTSDDGLDFTRRLEGCDEYITGIPEITPSQIDHLLVVIAPDGKATVYVNELVFRAKAQVTRGIQSGEPVMLDDIADITEIDVGVEIPPECGFILLFSWRWRKGFFFDLRPLGPRPSPRDYSFAAIFAACHCALMFPAMFSLTDDQWKKMIADGWFPFVGLRKSTMADMVVHCQQGWDLARLEPQIVEECKQLAPRFAEFCEASPVFKPHANAIKAAARHFASNDPLSAAHLLYPRIEGVLRAYFLEAGGTPTRKQERFLEAALKGGMVGRHNYCLLLLGAFVEYLRTVIFAGFDPANPNGVSRHTIAHGVVDTDQCDERSVALAFLSLHHLYYSLGPLQPNP